MTTVPETIEQLHQEVLTSHALNYLANFEYLSITLYFEYNCNGPIIQEMVRLNGSKRVLTLLSQTINELR